MNNKSSNRINITPKNMIGMIISVLGSIIIIILLSLKEQIGTPLAYYLAIGVALIFITIGIITYFVWKAIDKKKVSNNKE
ncbi:MAG: hypothetical protein L3I91_00675 [Mycoplasma sp.]